MILGLLTLLTALCISGIAAYYSIVGLTAIFAAAVVPIIIMGAVLELGKVVTTLWLHYNWERSPWKIKSYLVTAVVVIMFITSMGIFGFLSKAHLDQGVPSGDIQAQVSLLDEKIATQRDNITVAKKAMVQMDASVDQMMARTTDDTGATKSANLRRSQAKERAKLQADVDLAQKTITKLQEQRAPIASQFRKAEAEVGPIKYIAALIYGDKTDQNMLERAVRWVIIIIVCVFDPLAIVLILAATTSLDWAREKRAKKKEEKIAAQGYSEDDVKKLIEEAVAITEAKFEDKALIECAKQEEKIGAEIKALQTQLDQTAGICETREQELTEIATHINTMVGEVSELTGIINSLEENCSAALTREESLKRDLAGLVAEYDALLESKQAVEKKAEATEGQAQVYNEELTTALTKTVDLEEALKGKLQEIDDLKAVIEANKNMHIVAVGQEPLGAEFDQVLHENIWDLYETEPEPEGSIVKPNPIFEIAPIVEPEPIPEPIVEELVVEEITETEPVVIEEIIPEPVAELEPVVQEPPEPPPAPEPVVEVAPIETVVIPEPDPVVLPDFKPTLDIAAFPQGGNASFGVRFPPNPLRGDLFLRVDFSPSKLYKWLGQRWVEMDKNNHDNYIFDEEYIKLLVDKVASGEYDIDDLNSIEQEQIAEYLQKNS